MADNSKSNVSRRMSRRELLNRLWGDRSALSLMYSEAEKDRISRGIHRGQIRKLEDMYELPKMYDAYDVDSTFGELTAPEMDAIRSVVRRNKIRSFLPGAGGTIIGQAAGLAASSVVPGGGVVVPALLGMTGGLVGGIAGSNYVPDAGSMYDAVSELRRSAGVDRKESKEPAVKKAMAEAVSRNLLDRSWDEIYSGEPVQQPSFSSFDVGMHNWLRRGSQAFRAKAGMSPYTTRIVNGNDGKPMIGPYGRAVVETIPNVEYYRELTHDPRTKEDYGKLFGALGAGSASGGLGNFMTRVNPVTGFPIYASSAATNIAQAQYDPERASRHYGNAFGDLVNGAGSYYCALPAAGHIMRGAAGAVGKPLLGAVNSLGLGAASAGAGLYMGDWVKSVTADRASKGFADALEGNYGGAAGEAAAGAAELFLPNRLGKWYTGAAKFADRAAGRAVGSYGVSGHVIPIASAVAIPTASDFMLSSGMVRPGIDRMSALDLYNRNVSPNELGDTIRGFEEFGVPSDDAAGLAASGATPHEFAQVVRDAAYERMHAAHDRVPVGRVASEADARRALDVALDSVGDLASHRNYPESILPGSYEEDRRRTIDGMIECGLTHDNAVRMADNNITIDDLFSALARAQERGDGAIPIHTALGRITGQRERARDTEFLKTNGEDMLGDDDIARLKESQDYKAVHAILNNLGIVDEDLIARYAGKSPEWLRGTISYLRDCGFGVGDVRSYLETQADNGSVYPSVADRYRARWGEYGR